MSGRQVDGVDVGGRETSRFGDGASIGGLVGSVSGDWLRLAAIVVALVIVGGVVFWVPNVWQLRRDPCGVVAVNVCSAPPTVLRILLLSTAAVAVAFAAASSAAMVVYALTKRAWKGLGGLTYGFTVAMLVWAVVFDVSILWERLAG